ncbi:MAG TPA: aminotransferase class IV, partial [Puia sp.]|nr:aminotransferase class IV [Puia sp.]
QEVGTMNVFFVFGNKAITPSLEEGTILAGVTRDSVMVILEELGLTVEERKISIEEVIEGYKSGKLTELFGTGTAATISPIEELCYEDYAMHFKTETWEIAPAVKKRLTEIKEGKAEDKYGWLVKV